MTTTSFEFPGRWVEGAGLVLGPILMLGGVLLRVDFDGFFPEQLAAFAASPGRMTASYSAFVAGDVLLWPAVMGVVRRVWPTQMRWALWGGVLVLSGLFARVFHAGINHLAFQVVDVQGVEAAQKVIAGSYGAFHVFHSLSGAIFFGWIVLAVGAWRAGVLGVARAVALASMSALPIGVLKGTGPMSIVATLGLCSALVPLGVRILRDGPPPRWWAYPLTLGVGAVAVFLGMAG
ncbi:hypothetical protein [Planotetraspora kaengkrachanensis]|uniref:DUF4386 family protein n=1 Tax=Planotetraspora kaengkrachanensis TaxID=575193 RepID=A0A8J3V979_9ACTN|nr:hypothetical protein [Planotetraspora kaengkrachanensis]GIG82557.1 hypothetical protein Pka01_56840 [Planotetraspora kaengkrachanensis]